MNKNDKNLDFKLERSDDVLEAEHKSSANVITDDDFKLVNREDYALDQKFETKPTTFLKDSLHRFSKNKSSVVAAWILGILVLLALVVPVVDTSDVAHSNPHETYLEPKLFNGGTGFWDGTKSYSNIAYDSVTQSPDPTLYRKNAVSQLRVNSQKSLTNKTSEFAEGGYIQLGQVAGGPFAEAYMETQPMTTTSLLTSVSNDVTLTMGAEKEIEYTLFVPYKVSFLCTQVDGFGESYTKEYVLKEYSSDYRTSQEPIVFHLSTLLTDSTYYVDAKIRVTVDCSKSEYADDPKYADNLDAYATCVLIKSIELSTDSTDENYVTSFTTPSFTDAAKMTYRSKYKEDNATLQENYWIRRGSVSLRDALMTACSFRYDRYIALFGDQKQTIGTIRMDEYIKNGWCSFSNKDDVSTFKRLSNKCPIVENGVLSSTKVSGALFDSYSFECTVTLYKYYGYSSMPRYLAGTDASGRDMLKYTFEGLRTSLILGVLTSAICFIFGLCWGAISGYFGGNVDLAMERFTDILGGLPWIVVMTLCIVHLGQSFGVFALALCLTGWIGTSSLTRTQFYRFKGREYVLASRTLGASDLRLIFKHILPNAMGTIVTSAVLMIPSVVFSEATISYLGLGLKGLSSLGVILSNNQSELLMHPYLLIFPSVIIALLEICFNLFGNGLRDAINPTLKGEDEQ